MTTATTLEQPGTQTAAPARGPFYGLLLEFDHTGELCDAADKLKAEGYTRFDAHTPFPVHGLDGAMGVSTTRLPFFVFACGLMGTLFGFVLQWWTNAAQPWPGIPAFLQGYSYWISGKPDWSIPANIPVAFETTILFSAFGAVFGMLFMNRLPAIYCPLFTSERFRRATNDKFFISIEAADQRYDENRTLALAQSLQPVNIERVYHAPPARTPRFIAPLITLIIVFAMVPVAQAFKSRSLFSSDTKVRIHQDMGNQPKFKAQSANPLFADGSAMRLPPPGTVARGQLITDDHFAYGLIVDPANPSPEVLPEGHRRVLGRAGRLADSLPPHLLAEMPELLAQGQLKYNIYCSACHGYDGYGQGSVARRASELLEQGRIGPWTMPTSLHTAELVNRQEKPDGHFYYVISYGWNNMHGYKHTIEPRDRWAIVAYIRAMQLSQSAEPAVQPAP